MQTPLDISLSSPSPLQVTIYDASQAARWNTFVATAKNATFILDRRYMDYHSARFNDCSVMIFRKNELVALFPAHGHGTEVSSHHGLTYGGLLLQADAKLNDVRDYFDALFQHFKALGFTTLIYKQIPSFYCRLPSFEEEYWLHLSRAEIIRKDIGFVVEQRHRLAFQTRRTRGAQKAQRLGMTVQRSFDFTYYWKEILEPNLLERHGSKPVHSLDKIRLLAERFPDCIRLYLAYLDQTPVAGVLIYVVEPFAAHTQYISAIPEGRMNGALDLVFENLLNSQFAHLPFFSFGTAQESEGLNQGLVEWKEGFGARAYPRNFYRIDLKNPLLGQGRLSELGRL
jgi:hypothetical protein